MNPAAWYAALVLAPLAVISSSVYLVACGVRRFYRNLYFKRHPVENPDFTPVKAEDYEAMLLGCSALKGCPDGRQAFSDKYKDYILGVIRNRFHVSSPQQQEEIYCKICDNYIFKEGCYKNFLKSDMKLGPFLKGVISDVANGAEKDLRDTVRD